VILVPKFSESHPLSLWAIYILMIVAFVWLYTWALGEFVSKPMDKDSKIKYMGTLIFSFQSNEASVIEHIASIVALVGLECWNQGYLQDDEEGS
jgi:hypothetical protein